MDEFNNKIDLSNGSESGNKFHNDYIIIQMEEAVEHLQKVIRLAKGADLNESDFWINSWDAVRHLNRAYNLRYAEKHSVISVEEASKLPMKFAKELGYTGKSVEEFVHVETE